MNTISEKQETSGGLRREHVILAGLSALILTVGLARFAYTPLLPIMRAQAGLSVLSGGWLATWNYAGYMAGAVMAANISQLKTKFVLYRLSLVVAVLTTLAMGLTNAPVIWSILRFLSGMSSVGGMLLASGLVLNWLMREGHKPELGLHFMGIGGGIAVSGAAVEYLAARFYWANVWIGLGILGALFFVFAWRWMPAPADVKSKGTLHSGSKPNRIAMSLLSLAYFCAGYGYVVSATFIVDMVDRLPAFSGRGSLIWVIVGVAAVPTSFVWDAAARRLGIVLALVLAFLLQILSIVLPLLSRDTGWVTLSAALFGGTFVGIVSLTLALVGRHNPDNPAKAMAKLTLSYGAAQIAGPLITGYLSSKFGNYDSALLFVSAIMLLGVILLASFARFNKYSSQA